MFERPHHQRIARILASMNAEFLARHRCCFAGGTCLALRLGEFRESVDMDFLCSSVAGYRAVRSTVTDHSLGELFQVPPTLLRDVRADRYGVRTLILEGETPIKLEVVLEGRIDLDCEEIVELPVPVLDRTSLFAEKLLANSDRYADRSTYARDVIDLLVMTARWGGIPKEAFTRAQTAYGSAPENDLRSAALALQRDPEYREACFASLAVDAGARKDIRDALSSLL
jgi:hypothetical protein